MAKIKVSVAPVFPGMPKASKIVEFSGREFQVFSSGDVVEWIDGLPEETGLIFDSLDEGVAFLREYASLEN